MISENLITTEDTSLRQKPFSLSYIHHSEDGTYVINCYDSRTMVISNTAEGHIVTIKDVHCWDLYTLAHQSYITTYTSNNNDYLSLGVLVDKVGQKWCRYDICLNNKNNNCKKDIIDNLETSPKEKVFLWSQVS